MLRVTSPLTTAEEQSLTRVMDCAFAVHRELGPGFKETIYERAYCLELESRGIEFECEKAIDVHYKGGVIPGQRVDLVVESVVVVEIKAVPVLAKLHERQVRSYLKTMGLHVGLLVNFNTVLVKTGMRRIVHSG